MFGRFDFFKRNPQQWNKTGDGDGNGDGDDGDDADNHWPPLSPSRWTGDRGVLIDDDDCGGGYGVGGDDDG